MTAVARTVLAAALALLAAGCDRGPDRATETGSAGSGVLPPLASPRPATLPAPLETVLANGLRVVVLPRAGSSLIAAEFVVLAGADVDPVDRAGLAEFAATLLTRGSAGDGLHRSAMDLAASAEALGGSLRVQAGWDASRIGLTVTTPKLAAALDLLASVVRHPAFEPAEIERLREQTIDGLRLSARDPAELAPQVAAQLVLGGTPYGHPRGGTERSVARITAGDLRALHRRHYRPDRAALVLAGDLDPDTGAALAAQVFGDWTAPAASGASGASAASAASAADRLPAARATAASDDPAPTVLVVDLPEAGQATVIVAAPLPPRAAPDHHDGLVAAAVLGGGYSSRLNREIRIERGLSYGASADYAIHRQAGALYASAQTRNDAAAVVLGLMRAEFGRLRDETIPDDELAARKASYLGGHGRTFETAAGIAALIAGQLATGAAAGDFRQVGASVEAVTADAVRRYARAHFPDRALRYVIAGDARQFEPALVAAGYTVDRFAAEALDLDDPSLRGKSGPR